MENKYAFVEKSLELFEPWMAAHKAVMASYDRADVLDQQAVMLAALFDCIDGMMRTRNADPRVVTSSDARSLCAVWMDWYDKSRELIKQISELQDQGFGVPRGEQLRACLGKAHGWIDAVRKLQISLEEIAEGNYHSLQEAMNAIRA